MKPTDLTHRFDAVEVSPVADMGGGSMMRVSATHDTIACWSVYLHQKEGGVDCIADCANEEDAMVVATAIAAYMNGAPIHTIK
jgi:hypothetical protein